MFNLKESPQGLFDHPSSVPSTMLPLSPPVLSLGLGLTLTLSFPLSSSTSPLSLEVTRLSTLPSSSRQVIWMEVFFSSSFRSTLGVKMMRRTLISLDDTCRDAAVGAGLAEHLLLLDGDVQVGTHHELLAGVLTELHLTSLCNNLNSHTVDNKLVCNKFWLIVAVSLAEAVAACFSEKFCYG